MYFNNFPKIRYNGIVLRALLLKAHIVRSVFNRFDTYQPYTIKQGERAEHIADNLYGDCAYDWVIYFANDIYDPQFQWPLDDFEFNAYVEKKYGKAYQLTLGDIAHYAYTGTATDDSYDIARKSWTMSAETYAETSAEERSGWTSVSVYQNEFNKNEAKRVIRLLSPQYLSQITHEMALIFNG